MKFSVLAVASVLLLGTGLAHSSPLDASSINGAQWGPAQTADRVSPAIIKAQVLLARARFSPGEIDGRRGENLNKAIAAFAAAHGLRASGELDEEIWTKLSATSAEPVVTEYTITEADVRGPFLAKLPAKLEEMQHLPGLGYTSARESIAEKFHMSEALLAALNPGKRFDQAGATILTVKVPDASLPSRVTRIEVDKSAQMLRAFGEDGALVAAYPVTAGSAEKPTPSETLKVTGVSKNPTYRYNPAYAFKGVRTDKPFTIQPGPNNPVGAVWIGLSSEGYGIHGTPEPGKVSKTQSHGCIRMANWDALQLASAVKKGVAVEFTGLAPVARDARAKATQGKAKPR